MPSRYLPIYLNDHLAGATLGVELARRTLRENEEGELGDFLRWLVGQLLEDRRALLAQVEQPSLAKAGAAWLAEKAGRLKANGHLFSYSPLSRLVGAEVRVKHESFLPTGAFKVRGGVNLVAQLSDEERASGLVAICYLR